MFGWLHRYLGARRRLPFPDGAVCIMATRPGLAGVFGSQFPVLVETAPGCLRPAVFASEQIAQRQIVKMGATATCRTQDARYAAGRYPPFFQHDEIALFENDDDLDTYHRDTSKVPMKAAHGTKR